MALPPPWIVVYETLVAEGFSGTSYLKDATKQDARDFVYALESRGWRVVPAWAVDDAKMRVTLGLVEEETIESSTDP